MNHLYRENDVMDPNWTGRAPRTSRFRDEDFEDKDPLRAARGIIWALAISSIIWAALIVILGVILWA